jgi:Na+/H+ antiporter NhaD/arsenite permease-like protein
MVKHSEIVPITQERKFSMNQFSQGPVMWQTIASVLIFAAAYVLILAEIWNRSYVALSGALLMLVLGVVPLQKAFAEYINWNTLFLLIGLYIISNFYRKTGVFSYLAAQLIGRTAASPLSLLLILASIAGVGSALFDGLLVIAALVPFTVHSVRILKISSVPFVTAEIVMANIGGMATLIGNTPNRLIGTYAGFTFLHFLTVIGPLVLLFMLVTLTLLGWMYRKQFQVSPDRKKELLRLRPSDYLADGLVLFRGTIVSMLILLGFLLQGVLSVQSGTIALAGALLIALVDYKEIGRTFRQRDYARWLHGIIDSQVLFFTGLFIMVGGLIYSGVSGYAAVRWVEITQGSLPFAAMMLLWITGLGSAAVDSIPFVAAMLPVVKETASAFGQDDALWWSLAMGAGIGGAGTLLGSTMNMAAAGMAQAEGERLTHWQYFKISGLITILMMALASIYLSVFIL